MAQLNVRELRKQKQRKKRKYFYFFKFSFNFEKAGEFKPKRVCKNPTKHFQGSSEVSCDSFNSDFKHLGNHRDSNCRNLFTQEIPRKVARDVIISHKVVALMTIFSKIFYF